VFRVARQPARLGLLCFQIDHPQILSAAIRRHVGFTHSEHDHPSIGRQRRLGDALQTDEMLDRERLALRRLRRARNRKEEATKGTAKTYEVHGNSVSGKARSIGDGLTVDSRRPEKGLVYTMWDVDGWQLTVNSQPS